MTDPAIAALEHLRRVADSVLGDRPAPTPAPTGGAVSLLNVPYVSQLGKGADQHGNDSGAACASMLIQAYSGRTVTPDALFNQTGQSSDISLSLEQISNVLSSNGVAVEQRSGLKVSDLILTIASARPAILLIKQSMLKDAGLTVESASGAHYVVGVGVDVNQVYIHDPLRRDDSGKAQGIPWLTFYQAWSQGEGGERLAVVPRNQLFRRMVVSAPLVNVRQQAGASGPIAGTVKKGDVFEISVIQSGWGKIGEGRWVTLSYLKDI